MRRLLIKAADYVLELVNCVEANGASPSLCGNERVRQDDDNGRGGRDSAPRSCATDQLPEP